jgi:hypothetical protein
LEVLCRKTKYPADFLILGSAASKTCPIIFGRPFLNTCGTIIDCKKEKNLTKWRGLTRQISNMKDLGSGSRASDELEGKISQTRCISKVNIG